MENRNVEAEEPPPLSPERFKASPEFRKFKGIMRRLLKVPKSELDQRVVAAKSSSPRAGNPAAPGRKKNKTNQPE